MQVDDANMFLDGRGKMVPDLALSVYLSLLVPLACGTHLRHWLVSPVCATHLRHLLALPTCVTSQ